MWTLLMKLVTPKYNFVSKCNLKRVWVYFGSHVNVVLHRFLLITFQVVIVIGLLLNVLTKCRGSVNNCSTIVRVFRNLFWKIWPLFGQILITCLKCSRASFSPSFYSEKMHWGRGWSSKQSFYVHPVSDDIRVRIPQKLEAVAFWSWNLDVMIFQSWNLDVVAFCPLKKHLGITMSWLNCLRFSM